MPRPKLSQQEKRKNRSDYMRRKRKDPDFAENEISQKRKRRLSNTEARQRSRERDKIAKSKARNCISWISLVETFFKNVQKGPTNSCFSCDRLFFERSIKCTTKIELLKHCSEKFLQQAVLSRYYARTTWIFCITCYNSITKQKFTKFNINYNKLEFPLLDNKIKDLTALERRLISPRIPFMKIFALGCDRQFGIRGGIVNVPVDVQKMFKTIPINPENARVIHLKLKRKTSYKSHYLYERIRPNKVYEAAELLIKSPLYTKHQIQLSDSWEELREENDIIFNADENEGKISF